MVASSPPPDRCRRPDGRVGWAHLAACAAAELHAELNTAAFASPGKKRRVESPQAPETDPRPAPSDGRQSAPRDNHRWACAGADDPTADAPTTSDGTTLSDSPARSIQRLRPAVQSELADWIAGGIFGHVAGACAAPNEARRGALRWILSGELDPTAAATSTSLSADPLSWLCGGGEDMQVAGGRQ
eukprot:1127948-Prorocentrum_minimum.AAC.1